MTSPLDHVAQISRESARFRAVLAEAADAQVPTCPDWRTEDLLWHLMQVQGFWSRIVDQNLRTEEAVEALSEPTRPKGRAALLEAFDRTSTALIQALSTAQPDEFRWMWAGGDYQNVAYIRRRQAHEALIHRIDAELTAGADRADIDPAFAADGVDEALAIMRGGGPAWTTFSGGGHIVEIEATDTGDRWVVEIGIVGGNSPRSGEYVSEPSLRLVDPRTPGSAAVSAIAAELDLWLWDRSPGGALTCNGDVDALDSLARVVDIDID